MGDALSGLNFRRRSSLRPGERMVSIRPVSIDDGEIILGELREKL